MTPSKKVYYIIFSIITIMAMAIVFYEELETFPFKHKTEKKGIKNMEEEENQIPLQDRMDLAVKQEAELTRDPSTGIVPKERLLKAFEYAESIRAPLSGNKSAGAIAGINWFERGPNNCGGRTRAIMVDPNDATKKTVFSAGVGGGLWKTTDIIQTPPAWIQINDFFANIAITSLCYDPTNTQVMYFGTGEGFFNADAIRGFGIFKSTDGGFTWNQLAATNGINYQYIQKIIVSNSGEIYAATRNGLFKSANGGATFTKVLGAGVGAVTDRMSDIEMAADGTLYAGAGVFTTDGVYKSATGNAGTWTKLNNGANSFPTTGIQRIEIACAPSNAATLYVIPAKGTTVDSIYKSTNAGLTWTAYRGPIDADGGIGADMTRGQAWYDLSLGVDPNNENILFAGGVDIFRSANGGVNWTQVTHWYGGFGFQDVHADQHVAMFEPGNSNVAYFGNDGGIYRTANANVVTPAIVSKHDNYNVTQFYACAMNPVAYSNQFLAGAQDNGSHQFANPGINATIEVTGGDGCFCHIDQNQPQYQFTSYVYNNYYRSTDGGCSFSSITSNNNGSFVNPTDYDDVNNNFYACLTSGSYYVILNAPVNNVFTTVNVANFGGGNVTHIACSPNTANRVFFGLNNGRVVRVDNANTVTPTATNITGISMPAGSVSCIAIENGNDNHLLATFSNYGINSIWETINGGTSWTSVEGNVPDMPVRWALFSPLNNTQALIATELGVWSTDLLNGVSTVWAPSNSGLANTRVDMLQIRTSDNLVSAATHGRGLFTSDIFCNPHANLTANRTVIYTNTAIQFYDGSLKASSWLWDFGDATTSTLQNPLHTYTNAGIYTVTLTINGVNTIVKSNLVQVLPNRGTPYTPAAGGNFDVNVNDFGTPLNSASGCGTVTNFERGNSLLAGKNGVRSGTSAWVTSLTANYTDNATAILYAPNFNFSAAGPYTLKIYRKNQFEIGYDGFRVEYSLNKGNSWTPLGTVAANWYDFANNAAATAFPINEPYFNSLKSTYTLCQWDVTPLAGNLNVAFRFVFKSDNGVTAPGVALDDFEIIAPVNNPLPVELVNFSGTAQTGYNLLSWNTYSESNNKGFEIQRSVNGISFESIGFVNGKGSRMENADYHFPDGNIAEPLYYYRLNQIDYNGKGTWSNIIAIRRSGKTDLTGNIFPNPVKEELFISFNQENPGKINFTLFNLTGQKVYEKTIIATSNLVRISFDELKIPPGSYLVKINNGNYELMKKIFRQ